VCRDHLFADADLSEASGFCGSLMMLDRFVVDLVPRSMYSRPGGSK
jgi:hypothetical protein